MVRKADAMSLFPAPTGGAGFKRDRRKPLLPGQRARGHIRQRGAIAERYEDRARGPFLMERFREAADTRDPCARMGTCDGCRQGIVLTRTGMNPVRTGRSVHVHHIVARSHDPGQRENMANLALLCEPCHQRYDADKDGTQWKEDHA